MGTEKGCMATASVDDDPAARYGAWADRMRSKRQAAKERIAADQAQAAGTAVGQKPSYWSTDALFADSRKAAEDSLLGRPDQATVNELLAVLDLREGAEPDQLATAYRRLAKAHHPDRFAAADEATQRHHAERMMDINRAYRHLRNLIGD